eukprot:scaffold9677_cov121-Skeletonema_dohrnii-CCMP3373.AAC.12
MSAVFWNNALWNLLGSECMVRSVGEQLTNAVDRLVGFASGVAATWPSKSYYSDRRKFPACSETAVSHHRQPSERPKRLKILLEL